MSCLTSYGFTCPKGLIFIFVCFRGNAMSSFYIKYLTVMLCIEFYIIASLFCLVWKVKCILYFSNQYDFPVKVIVVFISDLRFYFIG